MHGQRARQRPSSSPREPTWRSRQPTWRPGPPTWRPRRRTWWPRRPNLAFRGRSKRGPERPRVGRERPNYPRSKFCRYFVVFFIDFLTNIAHCVWLSDDILRFFFCSFANSAQPTKRKKKNAQLLLSSCAWLLELAHTISTIQLKAFATQRFARCFKESAPSPFNYSHT